MELGKAYVQVIPTTKGINQSLSGELDKVAGPAGTEAGNTIGTNMTSSISSKMKSVGKGLVGAGAIATAVSVPIIRGIQDAMEAYKVQSAAETKLTEIYKTRMGATKQAAKSTMELASALQKEGVIGDEVTLSGAQQLATFAQYPETVNTLLPAMDNLLAQQKGLNATSEDAVSIGNLMGKVMQGQTGALKRVGISFTDAQEEVLKYGTEEERAAMLAEVITSNVGNMNSVMADTPEGKMQQLSNTLGDIKEQIGAALAPALAQAATIVQERIVPAIERIVGFASAHPIISKIILGITGLLAIGGPLAMFICTMIIAVGSLTAATAALDIAILPIAGIVLAIVAAIAAAIAVGVLLYKNWDTIKAKALAIWGAVKNAIVTPIKAAFAFVKSKVTSLKNNAISVFNTLKTKVTQIWLKIRMAITRPIDAAKQKVKAVIDAIKNFFPIKIGKIFSGLKTPHFSIKMGSKDFGKLGSIKYPTGISVKWYAQGGIFDGPTIAGIGEAGPEAVVPLDTFWNKIDETRIDYDLLAGAVLTALRNADMTNELVVDGKVVARSVSPFLQDELNKQQTRTNRRLGLVY